MLMLGENGPVIAPLVGRLHVRDLRRALGEQFDRIATMRVVVLDAQGPPVSASVSFVRSTATGQRLLVCPECSSASMVLRPMVGNVACNRCVGHRTEHQRERTCASWRQLGGAEADKLIRRALRAVRPQHKSSQLERLRASLIAGDRDRAATALQHVRAAIDVADRKRRTAQRS